MMTSEKREVNCCWMIINHEFVQGILILYLGFKQRAQLGEKYLL